MADNDKQAEQASLDYDSMSIEELEKEFVRTGGVVTDDDEQESIAAPEPAEEVEQPNVETDEPVEGQEEEEAPAEPEVDERDIQMQEMELRFQRLENERERFEFLAGKNAGLVGHLKKQLQQITADPRPRAADDDDLDMEPAESYRGRPQQPRFSSALEDKVAELQVEQTKVAVERVYNDFLTQIRNDLIGQNVPQDRIENEQNAIMDKITPTLKDRFEPFGSLADMGTKTLAKVSRMVLQSAYSDVKLAKLADLRKQLSERKASQVAESRIVKQAASPSGSGGKSVQEPSPKSPEEMTAEEADAALIAQYGDGRGNLRSRR